MAIKVPQLESLVKNLQDRRARYVDIAMDLAQRPLVVSEFPSPDDQQEIKTSLDIEAIRNSLFNLFNTIPGQRFLWPDYGLDFYQYLFWPVTEANARVIGEQILRTVEKYEPRVYISNVNVQANPDELSYAIDLTINIPTLGTTVNEPFMLDTKSKAFISLSSSRNR